MLRRALAGVLFLAGCAQGAAIGPADDGSDNATGGSPTGAGGGSAGSDAAGAGGAGTAGAAGSGTAGSAGKGVGGTGTGGMGAAGAGTSGTSAAGSAGMGTAGTGTAGTGTAGTGTAGMGTAGTGTAGMGTAGMGTAGMGTAGMGTAGMGTAGMGTAGMGTAGMGTAGTGTAGTGTAGMGTAGSGTSGAGGASTGCAFPASACTDGNENRRGCKNGRVISRKTASTGSGFVKSDSTCAAYDDEDNGSGCFDAGADHTYKMFLRAGDTLSATLDSSMRCIDNSFYDATLKVYAPQGAACDVPVANCDSAQSTGQLVCEDYVNAKAHSVVAAADGWYSVIVDGSTAFDDEGDYKVTVTLKCVTAGCECP